MAIRYGFHMSISGSISNAAMHAGEKGYGAFQIFTANARSWKANHIDESEGKKFFEYSKKFDSIPFAHAPYPCNPASPKQDVWEKSIDLLISNMENCKALGIKSIVVHMGSNVGSGREAGIERIIEFSKKAMHAVESVRILFENSSGYTNSMGLILFLGVFKSVDLGIFFIITLYFADAVATIVGLSIRQPRLPYNKGKSVAGTLGFFACASLGYFFIGPYAIAFAAVLAIVESLPLGNKLDDNIILSIAFILLSYIFIA